MTNPQDPKNPQNAPTEPPPSRKRRKHGYRGYPNNPSVGGNIHIGSGFAGVGAPGATGTAGILKSGVITERTRQDAEKG